MTQGLQLMLEKSVEINNLEIDFSTPEMKTYYKNICQKYLLC